MQAQIGGVAVAHDRCCFREVQARHRDLRTLGFCGVREGAAGHADLISGADRQRHTPANFPQAGEQFWRVGHFAHHYLHPNTPLLAAQDMCEPYLFLCPLTNSPPKSSPPPSKDLNNRSSVSMLKSPNSAPCSMVVPRRPPPRRKLQEVKGGR